MYFSVLTSVRVTCNRPTSFSDTRTPVLFSACRIPLKIESAFSKLLFIAACSKLLFDQFITAGKKNRIRIQISILNVITTFNTLKVRDYPHNRCTSALFHIKKPLSSIYQTPAHRSDLSPFRYSKSKSFSLNYRCACYNGHA